MQRGGTVASSKNGSLDISGCMCSSGTLPIPTRGWNLRSPLEPGGPLYLNEQAWQKGCFLTSRALYNFCVRG